MPERVTYTFMPTPRALLLLLLVAPLLTAGVFLPAVLWLVPLVFAVALALAALDFRLTPRPSDFRLSRQHNTRLSARTDYVVELVIHNDAPRAVKLEVRDEVPAAFRVARSRQRLAAMIPAHGRATLQYVIRPPRRGDYAFGNLNARWTSTLGIFQYQARYAAQTAVKVYPSLNKIREYDQLRRLGRVSHIGLRRSYYFGAGGEFEQLRDYVPDDDYRRICWTATARRGTPITIEFNAERSQNIMLVVDTSRPMMTRIMGQARTTRLDLVINTVLLFTYIATSRGDRVGLMTFSDVVEGYIPPRLGEHQFHTLVDALYGVEGKLVEGDQVRALNYLRALRQRRSLVVLFTDPGYYDNSDQIIDALGAFYPHHLPLCVTLSDVSALALANQTPYNAKTIHERALAEQILDSRQVWLETLRRRGVLTLDVPAYQLTQAVVNKYLEIKSQARI